MEDQGFALGDSASLALIPMGKPFPLEVSSDQAPDGRVIGRKRKALGLEAFREPAGLHPLTGGVYTFEGDE